MTIQDRIEKLLQQVNQRIYEKEEVIALSLLAMLAGENIFMLGPPGVAKSLVARRMKYAFRDAKNFEYLMSRFSTPEEIFGPVSITKLKNEDKYERIITNYLPDANIVFLDEIWKAGPSIQNALLTIINEKVYRNGMQEIKTDIRGVIAASNELPERGQGLEALWDRFLVRTEVGNIASIDNLKRMLVMPEDPYKDNVEIHLKISESEYYEWSDDIDKIAFPDNILSIIQAIRVALEEYNSSVYESSRQMYVSDRRWRKIVRLLRASAFLNNRVEVDFMDCFLIPHCIWNLPSQLEKAKQIVANCINSAGNSYLGKIEQLKKAINDFKNEVKASTIITEQVPIHNPSEVSFAKQLYYQVSNLPHPYIRVTDFRILAQRPKNIKLFHQDFQLFGHYPVVKSRIKNHLQVNGKEYPLVMDVTYKTVTREVVPDEEMIQGWQDHLQELNDIKQEILDALQQPRYQDVPKHLFVSANIQEILKGQTDRLKSEVKALDIELRSLIHKYQYV